MDSAGVVWFADRHRPGSGRTELESGLCFSRGAAGLLWATRVTRLRSVELQSRPEFSTRPLAYLRTMVRLLPFAPPGEVAEFLRPHLIEHHDLDSLLPRTETYPVTVGDTHYCAVAYLFEPYVYGAVVVNENWYTFLCPRPADVDTDITIGLTVQSPPPTSPPSDHLASTLR